MECFLLSLIKICTIQSMHIQCFLCFSYIYIITLSKTVFFHMHGRTPLYFIGTLLWLLVSKQNKVTEWWIYYFSTPCSESWEKTFFPFPRFTVAILFMSMYDYGIHYDLKPIIIYLCLCFLLFWHIKDIFIQVCIWLVHLHYEHCITVWLHHMKVNDIRGNSKLKLFLSFLRVYQIQYKIPSHLISLA